MSHDDLRPIYITDDSPEDLELTTRTFMRAEIANPLATFRDGTELLARLGLVESGTERAPLLILLDVKMPRMDGVEALREIRKRAALRRIPVIMLASSRQHRDLLESYDLGADAYVVKPLDIAQYRAALASIGDFRERTSSPPPAISVA